MLLGPTAIPGVTVSGVNGVSGVGGGRCKELQGRRVTPNSPPMALVADQLDQWENRGHTGALLKLGAPDHFRDLS